MGWKVMTGCRKPLREAPAHSLGRQSPAVVVDESARAADEYAPRRMRQMIGRGHVMKT
jgi:hypothetical protein